MPHSLDGKDAYDMCHELRAIGLNTEKGKLIKLPFSDGSDYGNRTRVPCVRGMCPSR